MTSDPAVLENERDFLLRSLDDLDAEYAEGNIDDASYVRRGCCTKSMVSRCPSKRAHRRRPGGGFWSALEW